MVPGPSRALSNAMPFRRTQMDKRKSSGNNSFYTRSCYKSLTITRHIAEIHNEFHEDNIQGRCASVPELFHEDTEKNLRVFAGYADGA